MSAVRSYNISILKQQIKSISGLILALVMLVLLAIITYLTEKQRVGILDFGIADSESKSFQVPYFLRWNHSDQFLHNVTSM